MVLLSTQTRDPEASWEAPFSSTCSQLDLPTLCPASFHCRPGFYLGIGPPTSLPGSGSLPLLLTELTTVIYLK
jgi:hypothetical protein